jgi:hypothetical protein
MQAGSAQCRMTAIVRASARAIQLLVRHPVLAGARQARILEHRAGRGRAGGRHEAFGLRKSAMAVSAMVGGAWRWRTGVSTAACNWHKYSPADV